MDSQPAETRHEAEQDAVVDPVVDATRVLPKEPDLPSATLFAFCVDIAQKIHPYPLIATRYGFLNDTEMANYIQAHPAVRSRIKEMRSVWFSDANVETRLRKLAGHAVLAALPSTADIMFNPRASEAMRIDALKAHARIAGVDGLPAAAREGTGGAGDGAGKFSIQIVFPNAGKTENINTIDVMPVTPVVSSEPDED
jgi:hypothetical protein